MDEARWKEISELAGLAAGADAAERERLLGERPGLRAEVESLLAHLAEGSGPLDRPPAVAAASAFEGQVIGPYRVLRELGRGGMGVVLLAQRTDPQLDQLVALKLARASFESDFFSQRFIEERQILARLEHPNIARLLDGGVTEGGMPYLALQYVEGVPLDEWRRTASPDVPGSIRLFLKSARRSSTRTRIWWCTAT